VRASILFVALIAFAIDLAIIDLLALVWLVLQAISFITVTRFAYRKLA
jgi:hypothetical protein